MASGGIKPSVADKGWWWLALAAVALACLLINPVGYVGGSADDSRYLAAARCWVEAGQPCLPHDHWSARWPLLVPVALASSLFGETRWTIGLGPLAAWAATIVLLA